MSWLLSYVGSQFALIVVVVLVIAILGVIAWFAKNWKVAVAAACVLCAGLAYQQIDKNAYQRRVNEENAAKIKILQARIDTMNQVNEKHAERAIDDATEIGRLKILAGETPADARVGLDGAAARRVSRIR